jgi:hypothetical protein
MKKLLKILKGGGCRAASPPDIFEKSRRDLAAKEKRNASLLGKPFFKRHQPRGTPWMVDKCSAISLSPGFVYCRIPKAANSSVMATLYNAQHGKAGFSREEMNQLKFHTYLKPSDLSEKDVTAARDFFSFTICRDPVARLLSAYKDKVMDRSNLEHRCEVARFLGRPIDAEIGFDEFLDFIESDNGLKVNYHWAPQAGLLAIQPEKLSFIGRVENLAADLAFVVRSIFGDDREIINWSPHSTREPSCRDSREPLTRAQKARISVLYRQDFEVFCYPPPDAE